MGRGEKNIGTKIGTELETNWSGRDQETNIGTQIGTEIETNGSGRDKQTNVENIDRDGARDELVWERQ